MRTAFHEELDRLSGQLVDMTEIARDAMRKATTALLQADLDAARDVAADDERLDGMRQSLDDLSVNLLARQQPVATDLRVIVAALQMGADLERMGDLARHVAKIAERRHPNIAVPEGLRGTVVRMGEVADRVVSKATRTIATRNLQSAFELERDDDEMDSLHRQLYAGLLSPASAYETEAAVDLALLGRYYERFADHAVAVARRVVYLVTGVYTEDDTARPAPHPHLNPGE